MLKFGLDFFGLKGWVMGGWCESGGLGLGREGGIPYLDQMTAVGLLRANEHIGCSYVSEMRTPR